MHSRALLHLSLINHIGPATIEKLVQWFSLEQLDQLYSLSAHDITNLTGLTPIAAQRIIAGLADTKLLEQELNLIERHQFRYITLYDTAYPPLLKAIYLPPPVLYIHGGSLQNTVPHVALVGSRQADRSGTTVINRLVPDLITAGYTIVSGGALGIDTLAHRAALNAQGATVAVLGSGLLRPYPAINKGLFDTIASSGGSVISPFPLVMAAFAGNFPARNRIISGLSNACIVIQATEKSGALITARYALEQGREVGAVPGPIDAPLNAGCHKLIRDGAALITSSQDIISLVSGVSAAFTFIAEKSYASKSTVAEPHSTLKSQESCPKTPKEHVLFYAREPISFDELLLKSGMIAIDLQDLLFTLQLEGSMQQNFMGLWQSCVEP